MDIGVTGVQAGFARLDRAAGGIARDAEGDDLSRNMVELIRARQEVRANLAVVRASDEVIGTLIDTLL